jgi:hypothetical protein
MIEWAKLVLANSSEGEKPAGAGIPAGGVKASLTRGRDEAPAKRTTT